MKDLFKSFLLSLLPLFALAQEISWPTNVATKEDVRRANVRIDSVIKAMAGGGTIPILKPCLRDITLGKILDPTTTSLTYQFDAVDVRGIDWKILDGLGLPVAFGKSTPTSNTVPIAYQGLIPADYTLVIDANTCKTKPSSKLFNISGSGGITPPPVPGSYQTITKGLPEQANFVWKFKDGKNYVSDVSNPPIGGDYEFRYIIGSSVIVTGKESLKDYEVNGFAGRIVKYKIKPGKVLNQWEPEDNGYYDRDAGESFSYNSSIAFHTFALPGAKGSFLNPIPFNFNPAIQNVHWGDIAQDMNLPKGHVYVADPRPWGIDYAFKKGVTHISNFALPWDDTNEVIRLFDAGKTYNDVQRIETVFGIEKSGNTGLLWPDNTSKDWWPNGAPSEEEGYQIGLKADKSHALFIGEMSENESWLPPYSPAFRGFHKGFREGYEERFGKRGIPFYICHDYIWLGGEKMNTGKGRDYYKKILTLPIDQQPANDYTPGGSLVNTNLIVETIYLGAPDNVISQPYELIFRLKYINQLGYNAGGFMAFAAEWKPNNMLGITYPEGEMYPHVKIPLDPNLVIANGFLSQVFGKLFLEWGGGTKTPDRLLPLGWYGTSFHWFPTGATTPQGGFPHFKTTEGYPTYYGYNGSTDLVYFSQKLFSDTYAPVEGGIDRFLKFRIDGGKWVNPTDEDFIDAYHDKRGFVHSRTLNGKTAFFYLSCFQGDNLQHQIEVELPNGKIWSGYVSDNGIHAQLI